MLVSVIIPCHNVARYVEACLESTLAQSHPAIEVIAVDDGSTDGTGAILSRYERLYPARIRVLTQLNAGAAAARNTGLQVAKGTYVQFLDADDILFPEKIRHQVALAQQHGDPALIVGSSCTRSVDGHSIEFTTHRPGEHDIWSDLMLGVLGNTVANLWLRSAVLNAGGWREDLSSSQEYDLMFRMLCQDVRPVFDMLVLTEVRKRAGSITQTDPVANWTRFLDLRIRIFEHVRTHAVPHDEQIYLQFLFDSIRVLYRYDERLAVDLHHKHIPHDFRPSVSAATSRPYTWMHRSLGFRRAQQVWSMLH